MSFEKPTPGTALKAKRARKRAAQAQERAEMTAAKERDGGRCRVCGCPFDVEAAHVIDGHRGMGGDPTGLRTERSKVITLCRTHHRMYDAYLLFITPMSPAGFDGPVVSRFTRGLIDYDLY